MPTKWQLRPTSSTGMSLEYEHDDEGKMDDDRLLLGLRQSFVSRPVRMLGFPVLSHGLRLVSDHVAPLVGAKHAGAIVHAEMCVHEWCWGYWRGIHSVDRRSSLSTCHMSESLDDSAPQRNEGTLAPSSASGTGDRWRETGYRPHPGNMPEDSQTGSSSYYSMGATWRVGCDERSSTPL